MIRTDTRVRLFVAVPIPALIQKNLIAALNSFPQYIEQTIDQERWHLTLVFLGEVENPRQYWSRLTKALPQAFMPTISITHIGRGLQRDQLWAYAHPTAILFNLYRELGQRLRGMRFPLPRQQYDDFVPHVHVANLYPMARGIGIADAAVTTTFSVRELLVYRSVPGAHGSQYATEAAIPLGA